MARIDAMKTAAANLKAHKAVESAAPTTEALPECRHCHTPLDTAAQNQGSKGRDGGWTCGPCIKLAAGQPAKPKVEPTVGIVPLDQQLTDKEAAAKAKVAPKPAPTAVVTIPAEQIGTVNPADEKRLRMLATLQRAREVRAERLANGTLNKPVKPAAPKASAVQPAQPAQPAQLDRLETLIQHAELLCTRMTDLCKALEIKVAA